MAYRRYTDKDRITALELLALGHSLSDVSRALKIPISTIKGWNDEKTLGAKAIKKDLNSEELAKFRKQKKEEFVNNAWEAIDMANQLIKRQLERALEQEAEINKLLDDAIDEIETSEMEYKEKQAAKRAVYSKIAQLKIEDINKLSTTLGTLYDKQALAQGDATVNAGIKVQLDGELEDFAD
jgi:signal transduction histidine kinase